VKNESPRSGEGVHLTRALFLTHHQTFYQQPLLNDYRMMRTYLQDALITTVLALGVFYACKAAYKGLLEVKDAARSPTPEPPGGPPPKQLAPDAEDKIELDTLRNLSEGPSFELRNAAIRIVTLRALADPTRQLLLRHLASPLWHHRDNAINTLWLLFYGTEIENDSTTANARSRFQDKEFFEAIVAALIHTIPYHRVDSTSSTPYPPSPIRPLMRPPHEKYLFKLLTTSLTGSIRNDERGVQPLHLHLALDAGLVTKWLAIYPFPCTLPQYAKFNYHRSDVSSLFSELRYAADDEDMYKLMRMILTSSKGTSQLSAVGLRWGRLKDPPADRTRRVRGMRSASPSPSTSTRRRDGWNAHPTTEDVRMTNGADTAGEIVPWDPVRPPPFTEGWDDEPHPRLLERSSDEVRLRRMNRETMVVAERGEVLSSENILRRNVSDAELGLAGGNGRTWQERRRAEGERDALHEALRGVRAEGEGEVGEEVEVESEGTGSMPDLAPILPEDEDLFLIRWRRSEGGEQHEEA
jgi:hypothetical protein